MTRGDQGEQEDRMSEGFHSTGSGGGEPQNNPAAEAAGPPPASEGTAHQGAPSAIASNPTRPDLPVPDMSTPEGLAAARSVLQRAMEIASRQTLQSPEPSWADERPQSAQAAAGGTSVPAPYESTPGDDSQVLRISSPQTTGVHFQPTGAEASNFGPTWGGLYSSPPSQSAAPLQPTMPTWSNSPVYGGAATPQTPGPTPRMRTAIAAYGGYALQDAATPKDTQNAPPPTSSMPSSRSVPPSRSVPTPATGTATSTYRFGGMPQHIKNAVRLFQPFYSDNTTVDKARAFWDAFVRATTGLDEPLRLSAFRECLKGKSGEEWWMYSRIEDFETLRIRFHNQFICLTPLQMIERLKNTKRSKGISAEVWGDLIQGLCDEAQCFDSRMRYQYFLSGLRNKEWKTALSTAMVNFIQQAVAVLLYKNMHIPVEDEADFADVVGSASKSTTAEGPLLAQMMQLLQANQNLILQQQKELAQSPRSPRRSNYAAATYDSHYAAAAYDNQGPPPPSPNYAPSTPANVPQSSVRGIRQGPDMYTQDGRTVCGRCHLLGCSRINCRRANATCPHCKQKGHVGPECESPQRNTGNGGSTFGSRRPGGSRTCWACNSPDHYAAQCPTMKAFMQTKAQDAPASATGQGPTPAQQ